MTAVKIVLEPEAHEFKLGRWRAVLVCPLTRWRNRPAWESQRIYLNRGEAVQAAQAELDRLERQTWMGES